MASVCGFVGISPPVEASTGGVARRIAGLGYKLGIRIDGVRSLRTRIVERTRLGDAVRPQKQCEYGNGKVQSHRGPPPVERSPTAATHFFPYFFSSSAKKPCLRRSSVRLVST